MSSSDGDVPPQLYLALQVTPTFLQKVMQRVPDFDEQTSNGLIDGLEGIIFGVARENSIELSAAHPVKGRIWKRPIGDATTPISGYLRYDEAYPAAKRGGYVGLSLDLAKLSPAIREILVGRIETYLAQAAKDTHAILVEGDLANVMFYASGRRAQNMAQKVEEEGRKAGHQSKPKPGNRITLS